MREREKRQQPLPLRTAHRRKYNLKRPQTRGQEATQKCPYTLFTVHKEN